MLMKSGYHRTPKVYILAILIPTPKKEEVKEPKFTRMAINIVENGIKTSKTAEENSGTLMVTSTKVNG